MENVRLLTQAYNQAPWRKQIQMIVFFLLILVMIALVAGIYLNVSARTVAAGVEIQEMEDDMEFIRRSIQDLETELAILTSALAMEARAEDLGLKPVDPTQIEYVQVPGYLGRSGPAMAPSAQPSGTRVIAAPGLSSEFTESIIEWFITNVLKPSGVLEMGQ
jgi:hypothetical protein